MKTKHALQLGIMPEGKCSYLPDQTESLAVVLEPELHSNQGYDLLLANGFRRNGNYIYRPNCRACQACQSIRVNVNTFKPSKTQKKQINQLSTLNMVVSDTMDADWFALYERYIKIRHRNGSMHPADCNDFLSFIQSEWQETRFLHLYDKDTLLGIAVTDVVKQGHSALYTFFDPEHPWSLGTLFILAQIQHTQLCQLPWLYLGFQIDDCAAMAYKKRFRPHQRFIKHQWV